MTRLIIIVFVITFVFGLNLSCAEILLKENNSINPGQRAINSDIPKLSQSIAKPKKNWQVGSYKGLVIGKASLEDTIKILGKPSEIVDLKSVGNEREWAYHYKNPQDIKGQLLLYIDKKTKTVSGVIIRPDSMSKKESMDYFGQNYIVTRYSFSDCPGDTFDSAPYYEDPNGVTEFIEYRDRGIAVLVAEDEMVQYVSYLSEPLGTESSECKQ